MVDVHLQSQFIARCLYHLREIAYAEHFGKLIEDAEFTGVSRIIHGNFNTTYRIANIQECSGLSASTINR